MYAGSPRFPSPMGVTERAWGWILHRRGSLLQERNTELGGLTTAIVMEASLPFAQGESLLHLLRWLAAHTTLRDGLDNEESGPWNLGLPYMNVQGGSGLPDHLSQ